MPGPGATRPSRINWVHADKLALRKVEVTASAVELNKLAGAGATVTAANLDALTNASAVALHQHALVTGAYDVTATAAQLNSVRRDPGTRASGVLRVAANVIAEETVEIGADVYEVNIVNTDSTNVTAGGAWDNVTDPLTVDLSAAGYDVFRAALLDGALVRCETEIMKVTAIDVVANTATFARGQCGTTTAVHADAQALYNASAIANAGAIPVGMVATLTPAVFTPAFVAVVNAEATEAVTAQTISNNQALVIANSPGVVILALAEGLTGADSVWDTAAMRGGSAPTLRRVVTVTRVPNATEVALDRVLVPLDFAPAGAIVQIRVTASGVPVAWDGNAVLRTVEQRVDIINSGLVDFAATDTITVIAFE